MFRNAMVVFGVVLFSAQAWAVKPCDELKVEIEAKIQSHGVKSFTLEIVAKGEEKGARVVGSCEGGSKVITYVRGQGGSAAK